MKKQNLKSFRFALHVNPAEAVCHGVQGECVTIPHTWNVQPGMEDYAGTAWYSTEFEVETPAGKTVLYFHGAYRDCTVYVNGSVACIHSGSGYTPFETDVSHLVVAGENLLTVSCSNAYSDKALPHRKDFDWANDGGLIRPVELLQYDAGEAEHICIESIVTEFLPGGLADAWVNCKFDFSVSAPAQYDVCVREYKSKKVVFERSGCSGREIVFPLCGVTLWNTEDPFLYELELRTPASVQTRRFGVRKLEARGKKIYLNNKPIRLLAVEWMPGSNPAFGMAEPESELAKNLAMLKDLKCNFTRFHWQQDDFVYDWCDEHGLMVQEEIPYWGSPKAAGRVQFDVAERQADEMLRYHFNHPSIVCWGVGNELGGWEKETCLYVRHMVSYFKLRDFMRLVNYVSNTVGWKSPHLLHPGREATTYGDICMWNEYLGTWYSVPKRGYDKVFRRVLKYCGDKPVVITEFGLCEPAHKGGDTRRIEIYREKLEYYQKYDLAGWVYFCLNDDRTHIGETGEGRFKQRIHGSVDLCGAKKPSYAFIQAQNLAAQNDDKD